MRMWLLRAGNAYWNEKHKQWTSKGLATAFTDSEVDEIELSEGQMWVADYETAD